MLRLATMAAALFSGVFLVACASLGPIEKERFEPKLRQDLAIKDNNLVFYSPAVFFPGIAGWEMPGIFMANKVRQPGVLALGSENVYFVVWTKDKYEDRWHLPYKSIETLELRSGIRIVIRYENKSKVVSFDAVADNGEFIDRQRAASACQVIAQNSERTCLTAASSGR